MYALIKNYYNIFSRDGELVTIMDVLNLNEMTGIIGYEK
jgi:hypothetical protein